MLVRKERLLYSGDKKPGEKADLCPRKPTPKILINNKSVVFFFCVCVCVCVCLSIVGASDDKESACNVGDWGLISVLGRSSGEENGNPFQYFCLENSMNRGAWWTTVHGFAKSQT